MGAIGTQGSSTFRVAPGTGVTRNRLMQLDSNNEATHATATSIVIGVSQDTIPTLAADRPRGDTIGVLPLTHSGQIRLTSSAAIAIGAELEKDAAGKVKTFAAGEKIGYASVETVGAADIVFLAQPTLA